MQNSKDVFFMTYRHTICICISTRPRPVGGDSSPPGFHPDTMPVAPKEQEQLVIGESYILYIISTTALHQELHINADRVGYVFTFSFLLGLSVLCSM